MKISSQKAKSSIYKSEIIENSRLFEPKNSETIKLFQNSLESKFSSNFKIRIEEKGDMLDPETTFGHQKSNEWLVVISTR